MFDKNPSSVDGLMMISIDIIIIIIKNQIGFCHSYWEEQPIKPYKMKNIKVHEEIFTGFFNFPIFLIISYEMLSTVGKFDEVSVHFQRKHLLWDQIWINFFFEDAKLNNFFA